MTPEQFQEWATAEYLDGLRAIVTHHFRLLPGYAKSSIDPQDMYSEVLLGIYAAVMRHFNEAAGPDGFRRFSYCSARKICLHIRRRWRQQKRYAPRLMLTSHLDDSYGDRWHPASVVPDRYPEDETEWTWKTIMQTGRVPIPPDVECVVCGDPVPMKRRTGRPPADGTPHSWTCLDPRCSAIVRRTRSLAFYRSAGDPRKRKRERYAARRTTDPA